MDEIIRKLYYGEVYPSESVHPTSNQYMELIQKREQMLEQFRSGLTEEQTELYEKIAESSADITDEECLSMFHEGVRFGVAIMEACRELPM